MAAARDSGAASTNSPTRRHFAEHKENEFPHGARMTLTAQLDRREILKVMAASAAFAGLTGCTKLPTQHIVPYVRQPEEIIPGKPLFYATAMTLGGVATGILVESHMARPTKIEGNPDHPGESGRDRRLRAGRGAVALRSRPFAGGNPRRAHRKLDRIPAASWPSRSEEQKPKQGRRPAAF